MLKGKLSEVKKQKNQNLSGNISLFTNTKKKLMKKFLMPYHRMSHFPEVYPFGFLKCVVTYMKKTVRKNSFVIFDTQLLQGKAEEVHLCFSVST